MLYLSGFELYSRWVPLPIQLQLYAQVRRSDDWLLYYCWLDLHVIL